MEPWLTIAPTATEAVCQAHAWILATLQDAQKQRGMASLALCGGTTPQALYARIATEKGSVDWQRVQIFWGDERAVAPDHADSNYKLAWDAWLSRSGLPGEHIHRMRGEATDLDQEAARYDQEVRTVLGEPPSLDVLLLGMGTDGHTASLFPHTPALRDSEELVVAVHEDAPLHKRLTITPRLITHARHVLLLTLGQDKAPTLARVLHGALSPQEKPVQIAVRQHPSAWVVCDEQAAEELRGFRR